MKVNTKNWLFRWAYLFKMDRDYVHTTTLCALFWRSVLLTPAVIGLIAAPVVAVAYQTALNGWWWLGLRTLIVTGCAIGFIGVIALCAWLDGEPSPKRRKEPSVIREAIRGIKERYCPIVYVERV